MAALAHIGLLLFFAAIAGSSIFRPPQPKSPKNVGLLLRSRYVNSGAVLGRPVVNEGQTLQVTMGMVLKQISDLDYKTQAMEVIFIPILKWKDLFLTWQIKEGNHEVERIRVWPREIFMPDIVAFNGASKEDHFFASQAVVTHDGEVTYAPLLKQRFACKIPLPFNTEFNCTMKFGSWTHDASEIDLQLQDDKADTSYYMTAPKWTLVRISAVRHEVKYSEDLPAYVDITYTLTLKKLP